MFEEEKKDRNKILAKKQEEYNQVIHKLDNLLEIRVAGEIDQMTFSAHQAKLLRDKENLNQFLNNVDIRIGDWFKKAENYLEFAETAEHEFENGNIDKKKEILSALGYNHSIKDKKLNVSKLKVFSAIEKLNFEAKKISARLEPIKSVARERQIKDLDTPKALALFYDAFTAQKNKKTILKMDEVLGLNIAKLSEELKEIPTKIFAIKEDRDLARTKKDWQTSDDLRNLIEKEGYSLEDRSGQSIIRKKLSSLI